ncbi:hypothetical protein LOZ55_002604 [Ophidiomyces ophidiicola]|nr:hypothetical protein LOZ55_002604 [Ophidiomyces ophidiicola]
MVKLLATAAALALPFLSMAASDTGRIVGGKPAHPGQFPSILSYSYFGRKGCAAVLIKPGVAVTAAHCVFEWMIKHSTVRGGTLIWNVGRRHVAVNSTLIHPKYERATHNSDIALLYLNDTIAEGAGIGYAELPEQGHDPKPGSKGTVAGWGRTAHKGPQSNILLYVDVPVRNRTTCKKAHAEAKKLITENMVCAGEEGKDSCQNDSGGPFYESGTNKLIGIVSWGVGCASAKYGGVYTRVGMFRDWIDQNITPTGVEVDFGRSNFS